LQLEITEIEEKKIDIVSIGNVRFGVTYLGIASIDCQPFFPQATISNPDHAETGHVVKMPRAVLFSQFLEKKIMIIIIKVKEPVFIEHLL
jgi:hypothetical protein